MREGANTGQNSPFSLLSPVDDRGIMGAVHIVRSRAIMQYYHTYNEAQDSTQISKEATINDGPLTCKFFLAY